MMRMNAIHDRRLRGAVARGAGIKAALPTFPSNRFHAMFWKQIGPVRDNMFQTCFPRFPIRSQEDPNGDLCVNSTRKARGRERGLRKTGKGLDQVRIG
jgi:hypothetical protein